MAPSTSSTSADSPASPLIDKSICMDRIVELKSFSSNDVDGLDALMKELSPSASATEERVRIVTESPAIHQYAVYRNGSMIGCATLCICCTPEKVTGFVEAVVVTASCRGQHLGRRLMERIIDDARSFGVQQLHLTSNPKRIAANSLYKALGFVHKETNVYVMQL